MNTQTWSFIRNGALALCLASAAAATMPPAVALADVASTALAIGIGAIVGQLIFDSSRNQYYYVDSGRNRHYVSNDTARGWYQRQDPQYYRAHQNDFSHNPGKFDRDFRGSHHPHPRP